MSRNKSLSFISKFDGQKKISNLWFLSSFLIILLFLAFTLTDRFGEQTKDAWQWILQQLIPSLTLIISVFFNSSKQDKNQKRIKLYYFRLTFYLSLGYFVLLFFTVFSLPVAIEFSKRSGYEFLQLSSVYLIPYLGVVMASMGMFFTKEEKE